MDNKTATDLLSRMPIDRSNYEFKNFNLEMFGSFPRQLRSVLIERETLNNQIAEIEAEIGLIKLSPKSDDVKVAALESQRNLARITQMTRKLNGLKQNLAQVNGWLDSQDTEAMKEAATKFEDHEGEYWTDMLGRAGAIDLLSIGRTRPDTMDKLSQLPLVDYKKTVTIISQLANFLKDTTEQAEATLYPDQDQIASGAAEG